MPTMVSGRLPNTERRRLAARLRAQGWTLKAIARRLGMSKQGAASLLLPLRGPLALACRICGEKIVSAGAIPQDAGKALCLPCLAGRPGATVGVRLKAYPLAAGLTRTELARGARVNRTSVTDYEKGRSQPRPACRVHLARALGIPPDALEPGGPVPRELL